MPPDRSLEYRREVKPYLDLFRWHYDRCELYRTICDVHGWQPDKVETLEELPYIPAQYFKHLTLRTTEPTQNIRSSGTSGRQSVIGVDRETIKRQQRALAEVLTPIIGTERKPFVVVGNERHPGIQGFLALAREWIEPHDDILDEPLVVVGFTVDVWNEVRHWSPLPRDSTLLHIGGWKGMEGISKKGFNRTFQYIHLTPVNLYGFTEQLGTVYPEYDCGYFHCPNFARVIVRDLATHKPCNRGMGQFLTTVPKSYPGFSVLTDDEIELVDCDCQPGQAFTVHGRIKGSETRGCGDVHRR